MENVEDRDMGLKASPPSRFAAYVMLILSYLIGTVSLLVLWIFFFKGSIIFLDLNLNETERFGFNTCLCFAFFVQHSVMIRKSFRRWLGKYIRAIYHGALYTIASGVIMLILVVFWQISTYSIASPQGILRWLVHAIYFLSIAGLFWGALALRSFDTLGIYPIWRYLRGKDVPPPMPLVIRGPYRWVRHPLYLFCILSIWSCPNLTADRLLFNILWTLWIIVGTVLEERDLVDSFGEDYREYQRKVPMLIPRSIRPLQ